MRAFRDCGFYGMKEKFNTTENKFANCALGRAATKGEEKKSENAEGRFANCALGRAVTK